MSERKDEPAKKPPLSSTLHHVKQVQDEVDVDVHWSNLHAKMQKWIEDAMRGENLPRSRDEILEHITDFGVAVVDGVVRGCASLWVYESDLAEIRSLGIDEGFHGKGLGRQLVQFFLEKARGLGIKRVFVLTRMGGFFEKCGFRTVSINSLPQKITKDCAACPKKERCDEVAMVLDLNVENGA